jgi:hypothetical protein
MRERRAVRTSFSAEAESKNGYSGQQLLDRADSFARVSGALGAGSWSFAAGASRISAASRSYTGSRLNAHVEAAAGRSWRIGGWLNAHRYATIGSTFAGGDAALSWLPTDGFRLQAGVERTALWDNLQTLELDIASSGPRVGMWYRPTSDLSIEATAGQGWLNDDNRRTDFRVAAGQRVLRGRNEIRLLGAVERLDYRIGRAEYFSPKDFWKGYLGTTYRGWFRSPQFAGDRERWVEATYLWGIDDRDIIYHSGTVGLTYEFMSGLSLGASGSLTRSEVYDSSAVMFTLRLRPFAGTR